MHQLHSASGPKSPCDSERGSVLEHTELLLRILSDVLPGGVVEGAYLFAETEPNQESVFDAGRRAPR